jgi:hypothetical protein
LHSSYYNVGFYFDTCWQLFETCGRQLKEDLKAGVGVAAGVAAGVLGTWQHEPYQMCSSDYQMH